MTKKSVETWVKRIQNVSEQVRLEFGDLPAQVLNTQPAPNQWSIAQVLDHLMVTNQTYPPILQKLRAGTLRLPFMARIGWLTR